MLQSFHFEWVCVERTYTIAKEVKSRYVNEIWSISATRSAPSSYTQINLFIDYSLYNKILSTQAKPGAQFSLISKY